MTVFPTKGGVNYSSRGQIGSRKMRRLTQDEQGRIMDFYFHCGRPDEINRGRDLIASNRQAARLYADLEQVLADVDPVKYGPCPDNLADLTIARLKLAAGAM